MPSQLISVTGTWTCPAGVHLVTAELWGGGGGGGNAIGWPFGQGGGGGGAYARVDVAVTPGVDYTATVGVGGSSGQPGGDTWFVSTGTVLAQGGRAGGSATIGGPGAGGQGGLASASVGTVKHNGGGGGAGGDAGSTSAGGGGGGSATASADGGNGTAASGSTPGVGGAGEGAGGDGRGYSNFGFSGSVPGGAGGAGGYLGNGGLGANGRIVLTWSVSATLSATRAQHSAAVAKLATRNLAASRTTFAPALSAVRRVYAVLAAVRSAFSPILFRIAQKPFAATRAAHNAGYERIGTGAEPLYGEVLYGDQNVPLPVEGEPLYGESLYGGTLTFIVSLSAERAPYSTGRSRTAQKIMAAIRSVFSAIIRTPLIVSSQESLRNPFAAQLIAAIWEPVLPPPSALRVTSWLKPT